MQAEAAWSALRAMAIAAIVAIALALATALVLEPAQAAPARRAEVPIVDSTRVDHDAAPIPRPRNWQQGYWSRRFKLSVVDPLSHAFDVPDKLLWGARKLGARTEREAVDVNAFDEVPNSSWFTNRNHVRAVPVGELRDGPDAPFEPRKPWTITHGKKSGGTVGFQIEDADGKKWLIKLDPRDHAQISSGADMVARTLFHAAGYNVPHNEPVRFTRADLTIDRDLASGAKGEHFTQAQLDSELAWGATFPDGRYSAMASRFLPGKVLGAPSLVRPRPGDTNDWYRHTNRRELRGLYVLCSWLGNWDTEDHQFLDTFIETRDSLGHVEHYVLDLGSTFGTQSSGPKYLWAGYVYGLDYGWVAKRIVTLGFFDEPWRRADQETGIPSIGHFESAVYEPEQFRTMSPQPAFRAMTDRDAYWGAKIVASFSDAQIAAAVDAAHYEDPRARDFLVRNIIVRRDKIARHWFERVAPLDFFAFENGSLTFHDLGVDIGLSPPRAYEVEIETNGAARRGHLRVDGPAVPLDAIAPGATQASLELRIAGSGARKTRVELARRGTAWIVTRVRHA